MRPNSIQPILKSGDTVMNGWCSIASSFSAEIMAHAGYHSLTLDLQHGALHYDAALPMLQAISSTNTMPMARVPWNEPGIIMKMLDAGCYGIICPMINTREECERLVGACLYPTSKRTRNGYRSFGPTRANYHAGPGYFDEADDHIMPFAMIETAQAVENAAAIISTPGLSGIYIGPVDLNISISGKAQMEYDDNMTAQNAALDKVVALCKQHSVAAGIHCSGSAHAKKMVARGFNFVTLFSDAGHLARAVGNDLKALRGEVATTSEAKPY